MAIVKCSNKNGRVIEIPVELYGDNEQPKANDYTINDGLINQTLTVPNVPMVHHIDYPISFKSHCMGVFVINEEHRDKIYFNNITRTGCDVTVRANTLPVNTTFKLTATGY